MISFVGKTVMKRILMGKDSGKAELQEKRKLKCRYRGKTQHMWRFLGLSKEVQMAHGS